MIEESKKISFSQSFEALSALFLLFSHRFLYSTVGSINSLRGLDYSNFLINKLDHMIPFIPIFIIPYVLTWTYGFFSIAYLFYIERNSVALNNIRCCLAALFCLILSSYAIWLLFPASITMLRATPEVLAQHGWLGSLVGFIYKNATVFNIMPSFHVAFPFLVFLISKQLAKPKHRWVFFLCFVVISLSTLFIKQHYWLDIPGAMLVAYMVYRFVFIPLLNNHALDNLSSDFVSLFYFVFLVISLAVYKIIVLPNAAFWGHKSNSLFDLWSLQHLMVGIAIGSILFGIFESISSRFFKNNNYTEILALCSLLAFAYLWEGLEFLLEQGLVGSNVAYWFSGNELFLNRIIVDPMLLLIGYYIGRKVPKLAVPAQACAIIFLFYFIIIAKHCMAYLS